MIRFKTQASIQDATGRREDGPTTLLDGSREPSRYWSDPPCGAKPRCPLPEFGEGPQLQDTLPAHARQIEIFHRSRDSNL